MLILKGVSLSLTEFNLEYFNSFTPSGAYSRVGRGVCLDVKALLFEKIVSICYYFSKKKLFTFK